MNKTLEAVKTYFHDSVFSGAMMIRGPWGCGKTHFWREAVAPYIAQELRATTVYVSLYGLDYESARKRISFELVLSVLDRTSLLCVLSRLISFVFSLIRFPFVVLFGLIGWFFLGLVRGACGLLTKAIPYYRDAVTRSGEKWDEWSRTELYISLKELLFASIAQYPWYALDTIVMRLAPNNSNRLFICLDDLERAECTPDKLLGIINFLCEQARCHVLLLCHEDLFKSEMTLPVNVSQKKDAEEMRTPKDSNTGSTDCNDNYWSQKEKTIDRTVDLKFYIPEIIPAIIDGLEERNSPLLPREVSGDIASYVVKRNKAFAFVRSNINMMTKVLVHGDMKNIRLFRKAIYYYTEFIYPRYSSIRDEGDAENRFWDALLFTLACCFEMESSRMAKEHFERCRGVTNANYFMYKMGDASCPIVDRYFAPLMEAGQLSSRPMQLWFESIHQLFANGYMEEEQVAKDMRPFPEDKPFDRAYRTLSIDYLTAEDHAFNEAFKLVKDALYAGKITDRSTMESITALSDYFYKLGICPVDEDEWFGEIRKHIADIVPGGEDDNNAVRLNIRLELEGASERVVSICNEIQQHIEHKKNDVIADEMNAAIAIFRENPGQLHALMVDRDSPYQYIPVLQVSFAEPIGKALVDAPMNAVKTFYDLLRARYLRVSNVRDYLGEEKNFVEALQTQLKLCLNSIPSIRKKILLEKIVRVLDESREALNRTAPQAGG